MFKSTIRLVTVLSFVFILGVAVMAQTAAVTGNVIIKKADGTSAPIEGVTVEAFRTDIKGSGPASTTDKRGNFTFAGLQMGATYVLSFSGPGAKPTYYPNVRPGRSPELKVQMEEGDGTKLTPDEVRQLVSQPAGGSTGELTEEQKKAEAERAAKIKEVTEKNAKIESDNKVIDASLKEGNAAFEAKNWDLAISKYDVGIATNPTYAGSAPVLLNNRGAALRQRSVKTYNENVKNTDASAKVAAFGKVKADLGEAADGYHKAWTIMKNAPATEVTDPKAKETQMLNSVNGAAETFKLMAQTEQVDETKIALAKEMLPEYQAMETDAAKKESSKLILGDLYRVTGDADNAIAEYRKVVEAAPENPDGLVGLGLSLVNAGFINNNKEQLQEGANVLQKFVSAAPETHKFKKDAGEAIEMLKNEQKITPQKVAAPARRRGN
ncbi:MAG: carboxypeptidase regulatory-like domain-containing protein [Pyrinomonadaceae bacterium]